MSRVFIVFRWIRWTISPKKNHSRGIYFQTNEKKSRTLVRRYPIFRSRWISSSKILSSMWENPRIFYPRRLWIKSWARRARGLAVASWTRKKRRRQSVVVERRWSIRWNARKDRSAGSPVKWSCKEEPATFLADIRGYPSSSNSFPPLVNQRVCSTPVRANYKDRFMRETFAKREKQ